MIKRKTVYKNDSANINLANNYLKQNMSSFVK